jgi:hypothetical protein
MRSLPDAAKSQGVLARDGAVPEDRDIHVCSFSVLVRSLLCGG